jgi:hypothetical protein
VGKEVCLLQIKRKVFFYAGKETKDKEKVAKRSASLWVSRRESLRQDGGSDREKWQGAVPV